jgi:predicted lipoprotein with Yx(FWY)xxD motif
MNKLLTSLMLLLAALLVGCASAPEAAPPAQMKGGVLVNAKGLTLYVFDKDVAGSGKSACNGDCAVKWPPLLATATDKPMGDLTIIDRADGRKQWAYKGKPLYTWPEDSEPGDVYGDNYNKVWHIVK